jgi:hypothetical protein
MNINLLVILFIGLLLLSVHCKLSAIENHPKTEILWKHMESLMSIQMI